MQLQSISGKNNQGELKTAISQVISHFNFNVWKHLGFYTLQKMQCSSRYDKRILQYNLKKKQKTYKPAAQKIYTINTVSGWQHKTDVCWCHSEFDQIQHTATDSPFQTWNSSQFSSHVFLQNGYRQKRSIFLPGNYSVFCFSTSSCFLGNDVTTDYSS